MLRREVKWMMVIVKKEGKGKCEGEIEDEEISE